jgi:hypothetical protein
MSSQMRVSPGGVLAVVALTEFRASERLRFVDGWFLRHFSLELREHRAAYAFTLECWRPSPEECDPGDSICGYVRDGTVNVEQHA